MARDVGKDTPEPHRDQRPYSLGKTPQLVPGYSPSRPFGASAGFRL